MRKGLVKKIVSVMRGGKQFQQTVWVKPKEHKAHRRGRKIEKAKARATRGGMKPMASRGVKEAARTIKRRERVMAKFRRQAPGKGAEKTPTKEDTVDIIETGRFALVSAGENWKSESGLSEEFLKERHEQLKQQLVADGFQFTQVKGVYNGGQEDSFLVWIHDADREHTKKLGEKYNQDSVIYGENGTYEAHYTTGEDKGKMEETDSPWVDQTDVDFSKEEYAGDFYTEVPLADGSSFRFKLRLFEEGAVNTPYKGGRREFLYGVDDEADNRVLAKYGERKKKR